MADAAADRVEETEDRLAEMRWHVGGAAACLIEHEFARHLQMSVAKRGERMQPHLNIIEAFERLTTCWRKTMQLAFLHSLIDNVVDKIAANGANCDFHRTRQPT